MTMTHNKIEPLNEQLLWIAKCGNYSFYDAPTTRSNGSIAVFKADVEALLNLVDNFADTSLADVVDTDQMQQIVNMECNGNNSITNAFQSVQLGVIEPIAKAVMQYTISHPAPAPVDRDRERAINTLADRMGAEFSYAFRDSKKDVGENMFEVIVNHVVVAEGTFETSSSGHVYSVSFVEKGVIVATDEIHAPFNIRFLLVRQEEPRSQFEKLMRRALVRRIADAL